jgi:hypothetical protein
MMTFPVIVVRISERISLRVFSAAVAIRSHFSLADQTMIGAAVSGLRFLGGGRAL